jgi:hypothetical protein
MDIQNMPGLTLPELLVRRLELVHRLLKILKAEREGNESAAEAVAHAME